MSSKEPTTPKATSEKRTAPMPSTQPNQETRFAWACFKSTGQNVNYDEVARLCGCSKDAARFRFYKIIDQFKDMGLLEDAEGPDDTPKSKKRTPRGTKKAAENVEVKLEDAPQDSGAEDLYEA